MLVTRIAATLRTGYLHLPAVIALAILPLALPARADSPLPDQAGWAEARRAVTTPAGQALTYVEAGPADGAPLILLHGYTDNSRSWSLLAPHLGDRRLIMVDQRGHGGSAAPDCCYDPAVMAADVVGLMDVLGIGSADVVGHSMGSLTAAALAAWHPERVGRLVLISTTTQMPVGATDWLWDNVPGLPDPVDPNSQFMLDWYYNPNPVPADFIDRERAESAATPRATWMGVLRALTATDMSQVGPRVKAPVLILWGDQDGLFDAESQQAVKAAWPGAEYEAYPGYGHNMFWEIPDQVGARITRFLAP